MRNDPFQVSPWDHQRHKRRGENFYKTQSTRDISNFIQCLVCWFLVIILISEVVIAWILILILIFEVVIAWIYLSFDVPAPDKNYNWEFLEDPFADWARAILIMFLSNLKCLICMPYIKCQASIHVMKSL